MFSWLLIAKQIFSGALAFVMKHWRVFLVLAMVMVTWYQFNALRNERDIAVTSLTNMVNAYNHEVSKIEAEYAAKAMEAKLAIAIGETRHQQDMEKHQLNAAIAAKKLKDLYENKIAGTNFNWAERVRLQTAANPGGRPEAKTDSGELAEGLRECDAAFTTLEQACKVTTADYNLLRVWADAACDQVGCEPGN
jgi:hypothetical protein